MRQMFSSFPLDHPLLRDLKVPDPAARLNITPLEGIILQVDDRNSFQ